jgi:hypothetical protein
MSQLNFPVSTQQLSDWLPHRGKAVWVDEVTRVGIDEGECRVRLRPDANYADGRGAIRDSSFVEWMAQAYGYVCACQAVSGIVKLAQKPKKAFLVQISDFELSPEANGVRILDGDWISVQVKKTHQLGPITLIEGVVLSSKELILARAKLKLFAE